MKPVAVEICALHKPKLSATGEHTEIDTGIVVEDGLPEGGGEMVGTEGVVFMRVPNDRTM